MSLRRFRLLTFLWLLFICLLAGLFLLGVGVRNPTGQRHSSEMVLTSGSSHVIGASGERVLAKDLGIASNNGSNRTCICGKDYESSTVPNSCTVCIVYTTEVPNQSVIPDFITASYIAESKNVRELVASLRNHDYPQLIAMAAAARQLRRPLWIYVRVDSQVDQAFFDLAHSTGGDVIYYFRVLGYVDPLEQSAWLVIVVTCLGMATLIIWELGSPFVRISIKERIPTAPKAESPQPNVVRKAKSTTDATEDFMQRAKRWSHDTLDKENED